MCSNPTRGFRRLLTSSDPEGSSQVRGGLATETAIEVPRRQKIPYSPKRHLSPDQRDQMVAGYLAGTTVRELGEKFEVHRTVRGHEKAPGYGQLMSPLVATKSPRFWPREVPTPH